MATIWKKNGSITRCDYNVPVDTIPGWYNLQVHTIGERAVTKSLFVFQNGDLISYSLPKDELRRIATLTLQAILKTPNRIDRVHARAIQLNREYFRFAEKIRNLNLSQLSNERLLKLHARLFRLQMLSHGYAQPTTWFVDSDGLDFSDYLMEFLRTRAGTLNLQTDLAEFFSILTTPKKKTFAAQEEVESLKVLKWIQSKPKLEIWFLKTQPPKLLAEFSKLPARFRRRLYEHYYQWCWLPYAYTGPAYNLDYYLTVWRGLLREGLNPRKVLAQRRNQSLETQRQRTGLLKKLKLTKYQKHIFDIAADIVWLKGFRKDCYYHGFFVLDLILTEIGKRSGLALKQAKFLLPEELPQALAGKSFANVANERIRFSLLYGARGRIRVLSGKSASAFLKKLRFQRQRRQGEVGELLGTCACPGQARGVVKIVNYPEEMVKMKKGNIMLAAQTYPSLVPAMKKAAAVVTEEGGITCHAAIISRELKIPCVVGVSSVTKVLKDGDLVEVDANKGVVRKIK